MSVKLIVYNVSHMLEQSQLLDFFQNLSGFKSFIKCIDSNTKVFVCLVEFLTLESAENAKIILKTKPYFSDNSVIIDFLKEKPNIWQSNDFNYPLISLNQKLEPNSNNSNNYMYDKNLSNNNPSNNANKSNIHSNYQHGNQNVIPHHVNPYAPSEIINQAPSYHLNNNHLMKPSFMPSNYRPEYQPYNSYNMGMESYNPSHMILGQPQMRHEGDGRNLVLFNIPQNSTNCLYVEGNYL